MGYIELEEWHGGEDRKNREGRKNQFMHLHTHVPMTHARSAPQD